MRHKIVTMADIIAQYSVVLDKDKEENGIDLNTHCTQRDLHHR